jgi:hypothetical protein
LLQVLLGVENGKTIFFPLSPWERGPGGEVIEEMRLV